MSKYNPTPVKKKKIKIYKLFIHDFNFFRKCKSFKLNEIAMKLHVVSYHGHLRKCRQKNS